jgi:DNA-binding transcriptional ArsR family regulator
MPIASLHPTLWRTCRVLANTTRLDLLALLARKQPQCVSELAAQASLTLPVASQSLRALESRGLLRVNRIGRRVEYRHPTQAEAADLAELVAALLAALRRNPVPTEYISKLTTAFTHPARIKLYRALQTGPKPQEEISNLLHLSRMACWRHLRKLTVRGFICRDDNQRTYAVVRHRDRIGQALSRLALA